MIAVKWLGAQGNEIRLLRRVLHDLCHWTDKTHHFLPRGPAPKRDTLTVERRQVGPHRRPLHVRFCPCLPWCVPPVRRKHLWKQRHGEKEEPYRPAMHDFSLIASFVPMDRDIVIDQGNKLVPRARVLEPILDVFLLKVLKKKPSFSAYSTFRSQTKKRKKTFSANSACSGSAYSSLVRM